VLWLPPFGSALARRFGAVWFFLFMAVTAAAGAILGDRVVKANPFLAKMTAGDLAAWADRKMGGNAAPMSIAGPASSAAASNLATAATPVQPQPTPQAAFQITGSGANSAPNLAALTATPTLTNLLPPRPNVYSLKIAPFSLRGADAYGLKT
jgi:hypothetical protein